MKRKEVKIFDVKVLKEEATVSYNVLGTTRNMSCEDKAIPHPDFRNCVNALQSTLAKAFHYTKKEDINRVSVTGFSFSPGNETVINVKGMVETLTGTKSSINAKVNLDDSKYGNEEEIQKTIEDISDEAYGYAFSDKRADPTMDMKEEEPTIDSNEDPKPSKGKGKK